MALGARILYSGDRDWVGPVTEIQAAPKREVLIISVRDYATKTLVAQCSGFDHYCLAYREGITVEGGEQVMLFGYDDGDYTWRSYGQPPRDVPPPLGTLHVTFQGVRVGDAEWQATQDKFTREG